jgi:hypothetical protein
MRMTMQKRVQRTQSVAVRVEIVVADDGYTQMSSSGDAQHRCQRQRSGERLQNFSLSAAL